MISASTSVVKDRRQCSNVKLERLQIISSFFARAAISHQLEAHLLTFVERMQTGALDRRNVNKYIWRSIFRLDKSKTFAAIKEFYRSVSHTEYLSICVIKETTNIIRCDYSEIERKIRRYEQLVVQ